MLQGTGDRYSLVKPFEADEAFRSLVGDVPGVYRHAKSFEKISLDIEMSKRLNAHRDENFVREAYDGTARSKQNLSIPMKSPIYIAQMRNLCVLFIAMVANGSTQILSSPLSNVCEVLQQKQIGCAIGIAGSTFCGVTGSKEVACRWDITTGNDSARVSKAFPGTKCGLRMIDQMYCQLIVLPRALTAVQRKDHRNSDDEGRPYSSLPLWRRASLGWAQCEHNTEK
eukprot:scaffold2290_cov170-Amphora_coffeaeformis.AAC.6